MSMPVSWVAGWEVTEGEVGISAGMDGWMDVNARELGSRVGSDRGRGGDQRRDG